MSEHIVLTRWWLRAQDDFARGRYSRRHEWEFDSGVLIPASPSPSVVRSPYSDPTCVDPEEAFVAAISSCHLLSFLHVASRAGFVVVSYSDRAVGRLEKNAAGVPWVSRVMLHPDISFTSSKTPTKTELSNLHAAAHGQCFIANSVKTSIAVHPPTHSQTSQ